MHITRTAALLGLVGIIGLTAACGSSAEPEAQAEAPAETAEATAERDKRHQERVDAELERLREEQRHAEEEAEIAEREEREAELAEREAEIAGREAAQAEAEAAAATTTTAAPPPPPTTIPMPPPMTDAESEAEAQRIEDIEAQHRAEDPDVPPTFDGHHTIDDYNDAWDLWESLPVGKLAFGGDGCQDWLAEQLPALDIAIILDQQYPAIDPDAYLALLVDVCGPGGE